MLIRKDETLNTANVDNITASIYRADQQGPSVTAATLILMPFKGNYTFSATGTPYDVSVLNPFVADGDDGVTVTPDTATIGTVEVKNGEVVIQITGDGDITVNVA